MDSELCNGNMLFAKSTSFGVDIDIDLALFSNFGHLGDVISSLHNLSFKLNDKQSKFIG